MLELRRVCFGYRNQKGASFLLNNVSLKVERGGFVAILGRNAAGKTTLAKLIKGLLCPLSGEILIDGQPVWPGKARPDVGLVFSNPDAQLLFPTVEEEMAFGLECIGMGREEIRRRVKEYLGLLGMEQFLSFPLHYLSKGQQQRVAIGAVLALEPKYLLLDEATSTLDSRGRTLLMSLLSELNARAKMSIIHFTTSVEEAIRARVIFILENGGLTTYYIPADISSFRSGLLEKGYPFPPLAELLCYLDRMGHTISCRMPTAEEMEAFLLGAMRN
jgi:energy-coupling factor transport system ATP-binding protein